ncbi:GNAT family N-acetyltransferase [Deinococcus sp. KSM4-11]|uniref:GNAT family N-acetyltransferase n=1 Tax=Deinococcus sp. KSM4-11 TaxID=2568654 RepID=UPI0010A52122|nr:GNAT family N-acetyltransferase [Deinococcus sp. KSM4-11]THF86230.1 GNAT family N-acetyltransferase [Deinococcus sp. KSM4-11]
MTHVIPSGGLTPQTLELLERQVLTELSDGLTPADRDALGLFVHDLPGAFLVTLTRYPQVLDFNRTINLGVTEPATDEAIEGLRTRARALGLPNVMVGLVPGVQPDDLGNRLLGLGARPARAWMQVWREAASVPQASPDVQVRQVMPDEYATFGSVMLRGFSMPPDLEPMTRAVSGRPGWTDYLAWIGGVAVACASLYVHGGYGWLGNATTLPEWRRHGAQSALITRRITDAARAGAHTVFTQVAEEVPDKPNPSEHNMRRAGFRTAYRRDHLILPTGLVH